jgi:hypothetical protein
MESSGAARNMQAGMTTATFMSPDLVGEMRLVLAPVDAEMGRGNGQMQVFTRSGTNQLRGSAVWSIRNSALDANTWSNNRAIDPQTGAWKPLTRDWANRNQYTLSAGGPIKQNKTFFFALWDGLLVNERATVNALVLTPCARNGIFRYFDTWNNGNVLQPRIAAGATPAIAVVDGLGNPVRPERNPNESPYTGQLRYASVFGPLLNQPSRPDCSDAQVQSGSPWDPNRRAMDSTGFVTKLLTKMPAANNYEVGEGLNTAGHRWTRSIRGGNEGIFGFGGTGVARKQINVKLDHNFNTVHKVAGTYTHERSEGKTNLATWPDTYSGGRYRHPQHLSITLTSTLSPTIVNEGRVGMRRTGFTQWSPLDDPDTGAEASAFFPNYNGYPVFVGLGLGQVNFTVGQPLGGGNTQRFSDRTVMWQYGDTLSWTKGTHAFKFGGEIRRGGSWGLDAGIGVTAIPRALGGDLATSAISPTAISATNMPGLGGTNASGNNQAMRNLLSFLAGSLGQITQHSYMQNPTKLDAFDDYKTYAGKIRDMRINEFSLFFKDDWKVGRNLTLNLGVRYDYFGVPYETSGLMPLPVGGGSGAFGISGKSFADWMSPGVRNGSPTVIQYVGKNSPNPDIPWHQDDWNNFGPAVGFAWQVPWFGAGKTTVRGGYQVTYQIGDGYSSMVQETNVPGSSSSTSYTGDSGANAYLDLTKLSALIPVPVPFRPMQPAPPTERSQQIYIPDPNLVTPYAQNLTLSVTRSIGSNVSVDLRYIGTLGRKQRSAANNINVPNFRHNGLQEAFDAVRAGRESALLDSMLRGINIAGAGFGPVGTTFNGVLQTAGMHMRQFTALRSNLANGNYAALAASLNTLNYATASNPGLPPIPGGVNGRVLAYNGFPDNFIVVNPQFGAVQLMTNNISNNYHSFNAQITLRPVHGVSTQSTYIWSKNLGAGLPNANLLGTDFTDPLDRRADYALLPDSRVHDFRTNGTFELPVGPGRLLAGNSSGVVARVIEGWRMSWTANLNSGQPLSIAAQNMLYGLGTADIVGAFDIKSGKVQFPSGPTGTYFDPAGFTFVRDPQCAGVTTLQNLQQACTLNAIASTQGSVILQNPRPGTRGTLGQRVVEGPGRWRFDASMGKAFRISESKDLQFRIDARNVFNHPEPNTAGNSLIMDINNTSFGRITGANAKLPSARELQAQLRFSF